MIPNELMSLRDDEFLAVLGCVSNPRALINALRSSEQVRNVRRSVSSGGLDESRIRQFVSSLLNEFRPGQLFPWDLTLAALAVVLEGRQTAFAEEYVHDLARLDLIELPRSSRVAREVVTLRLRLPKYESRFFVISGAIVPARWTAIAAQRGDQVGQTECSLVLGAA